MFTNQRKVSWRKLYNRHYKRWEGTVAFVITSEHYMHYSVIMMTLPPSLPLSLSLSHSLPSLTKIFFLSLSLPRLNAITT